MTRDGIIGVIPAAIELARATRRVVDTAPALDGKLRALQDALWNFDKACLQVAEEEAEAS